jgi:hypothetical protein
MTDAGRAYGSCQRPQQDVASAARLVLDRCKGPYHHVTIPHSSSRGNPEPTTALSSEPGASNMVVGGGGIASASQGYIPAHHAICWQYNMGRKRRSPVHAPKAESSALLV